ncbi:hypothetical protein BK138_30150 [Paenibacillus rhizosphaerae]|uniref:HTH tetR-type domain-containing protein n=1 Tax=Paenibacillus rhizosphaerae TaxID=297318 RepID=A0A1R1ECB5_9BACL|nr:TetR/AcrR family transcriptional regulator [Paenibacillus rhizosphaerae]OMF49455.1 hypothetical protein BK138_30150 [Paenibacillus rhizosphaerae]
MSITSTLNLNDPRVIRTRQLIMDAFVFLLSKQNFNSITISDITKKATINRATFYAHFPDKFALIDSMLADAFIDFVKARVNPSSTLDEGTVKSIVIALCEYHEASNKRCVRGYDDIAPLVEKNIKIQLQNFISELINESCEESDSRTREVAIIMMTWSIYGVTYRWNQDGRSESPEQFAEIVIPLLKSFIKS